MGWLGNLHGCLGGGGGVLGLEKGTDCGPTSAEWWLVRPEIILKIRGGGGCPLIILHETFRGFSTNILFPIKVVCIQICF